VPHLLGLYKQGRFPVDQLATVYGTEDLELAIEGLKSGDVGAHLRNALISLSKRV
jgi:Zn-dependent alcohol dehydrogenase